MANQDSERKTHRQPVQSKMVRMLLMGKWGAHHYWTSKQLQPIKCNWDVFTMALAKIPRRCQLWAGHKTHQWFLQSRKVMMHWNKQSSDACPFCSQLEDATHVWTCRSHAATWKWEAALMDLESWLLDHNTDIAVIEGLRHWTMGARQDSSPT